MAKLRIIDISYRLRKVRMVQNIEHFCSELQPEGLVNGEIAMNREIPLGRAEAS
jgi:hypothetical protein